MGKAQSKDVIDEIDINFAKYFADVDSWPNNKNGVIFLMHIADIVNECPVRIPHNHLDLHTIFHPQIVRVTTSIKLLKIILNELFEESSINLETFKEITSFNSTIKEESSIYKVIRAFLLLLLKNVIISDLFQIYNYIIECLILLILIEKQHENTSQPFHFIQYLSSILDSDKMQQLITILLTYYNLPSNKNTQLLITNSISLLFLLIDKNNIFRKSFLQLQDNKSHYTIHNSLQYPFQNLLNIPVNVNIFYSSFLLYKLLKDNKYFYNYIVSQADIEIMCLPLLKSLYQTSFLNSIQLYPLLLIFLLLSQDQSFNKTIHSRICIASVEWYHEENLKDIYLGSLLLIIILKVISQNSKHQKDQYIFQICYAIIFNTSSFVNNIHYVTSLRLLDLFKSLSRIHQKYYIVKLSSSSSRVNSNNNTPTTHNKTINNNNNNISSLKFPKFSSPQPPHNNHNNNQSLSTSTSSIQHQHSNSNVSVNKNKNNPEMIQAIISPTNNNNNNNVIHKNPIWKSTISMSSIPLNIPIPPQPSPTPITPPKLKFEISPCSSDTNVEDLFQPIQVRLEKEKKSFSKKKLGPVEDEDEDEINNEISKENELRIDAILYELGYPLKNSKYNGYIIDNDSSIIKKETNILTIYHIILESFLHIICFALQQPHLCNNINLLYLLLRDKDNFVIRKDLIEFKDILEIIIKILTHFSLVLHEKEENKECEKSFEEIMVILKESIMLYSDKYYCKPSHYVFEELDNGDSMFIIEIIDLVEKNVLFKADVLSL